VTRLVFAEADGDRLSEAEYANFFQVLEHVSFGGGGPHFCLGAWLARLEIRVLLEEILARGLRFELAGVPKRVPSNFVNGLAELPVRVTRPA
jgi:cytochrome P450